MPGTKLYTQNKLEGKVQGLEKGKLGFPDRIGGQEAAYFAAGWLALSPALPHPRNKLFSLFSEILRDSAWVGSGQWTALLPDH